MGVDLRQNADASASWLNELDNKEVARFGGPRTADATATSPTYRAKKVMIVPLTANLKGYLVAIAINEPQQCQGLVISREQGYVEMQYVKPGLDVGVQRLYAVVLGTPLEGSAVVSHNLSFSVAQFFDEVNQLFLI